MKQLTFLVISCEKLALAVMDFAGRSITAKALGEVNCSVTDGKRGLYSIQLLSFFDNHQHHLYPIHK